MRPKPIHLFIVLSLILVNCTAQVNQKPDASPMNAAYLPYNFAHDRVDNEKLIAKVYYSQPQKKGREIFGSLIPYGSVWRTGANEAVQIRFYQDVVFGDKLLSAGTYSLFTIPNSEEWTIIINSDLDYWGAYSYDQKKDIIRTNVASTQIDEVIESFSIRFETSTDNKSVMKISWDQTLVEVPITIK